MNTTANYAKSCENTEILFKALCNYLPYKVKIKDNYGWQIMEGLNDTCVNPTHEEPAYFDEVCKLILRPLSDLTKEDWKEEVLMHYADLDIAIRVYNSGNIKPNDFTLSITYRLIDNVFTEILINKGSTKETQRHFFQWLCENHFDIDNLIEKGLAIDINTLDNNQQS